MTNAPASSDHIPTDHHEISLINSEQDAQLLCEKLMEITGELISVLDRETALLRKGNNADMAALHMRKQALSSHLAKKMELLKHNASYIKQATPDHIDALKGQQKHFQKSLLLNQDTLIAMKAVSEQLLKTISEKAAKKKNGPQTYGQSAHMSSPSAQQSTAISIDRNL